MRRLLLFLILSFSIPARAYDLASQVKEFHLSNGMKWLVVYRPQIPVFSGVVLARVGGVDEEVGKTGLAHMFEHMAFKGSKKIGATKENEIWETLTRHGGADLNAFTSKDVTGYHVSLPARHFPLWAYIFSEMVHEPVMREFKQELDVVKEERRLRYDNSAMGYTIENFNELAYPDGPYHWSPIGKQEDLAGLTEEDAYAFHKKYYVPDRLFGVIVGSVPVEKAQAELEKYFGKIPVRPSPPEPKAPTFLFSGEKRKTIHYPAEPYLMIGFHKPNAPNRDDYLFDVLYGVLCEGRTGRFYKELVLKQKVASAVSCSTTFPGSRLNNLFVIFAGPNKGVALEDLEKKIYAELETAKGGIAREEFDKVATGILHDFLWGMENNMNLAEQLVTAEALLGGWRYITNYQDVLLTISEAEVKNAAKKYFVPENRVVIYRERGER
ncbi:MAG: pitrilysin family protein [Deltaproteobacteria bacterium]|nr:pitrilysin family protein [Deltaproteobacteria bacterium]